MPQAIRPPKTFADLAGQIALGQVPEGLLTASKFAPGAPHATIVVAASNAPAKVKATADYVCDGIADDVEINAALQEAKGKGSVRVTGGAFATVDAMVVPSRTPLRGEHEATRITFGPHDPSFPMLVNEVWSGVLLTTDQECPNWVPPNRVRNNTGDGDDWKGKIQKKFSNTQFGICFDALGNCDAVNLADGIKNLDASPETAGLSAKELLGDDEITIEALCLDGNNANQANWDGTRFTDVVGNRGCIHLRNVRGLRIRDVTVLNPWACGINLEDCSDVWYDMCRVRNSADDGIGVDMRCTRVQVSRCFVSDVAKTKEYGGAKGIEVQDDCHDISVTDCVVTRCKSAGLSVADHSGCLPSSRVAFTGNIVRDCCLGVELASNATAQATEIAVANNVVSGVRSGVKLTTTEEHASWVVDDTVWDNSAVPGSKWWGKIVNKVDNQNFEIALVVGTYADILTTDGIRNQTRQEVDTCSAKAAYMPLVGGFALQKCAHVAITGNVVDWFYIGVKLNDVNVADVLLADNVFRARHAWATGIALQTTSRFSIRDNRFDTLATGWRAAYFYPGGTFTDVDFRGNVHNQSGYSGVEFGAATYTRVLVEDNVFVGTFSKPVLNKIYDPGVPTGVIARRNTGWLTEAQGTTAATIAAAATYVDVAHGLSVTPTAHQVAVVPTSALGSATQWWISDIGATTFRINVDQVPGVDIAFAWQVNT